MEIKINKDTQKICRKGMHVLDKSEFTKESKRSDGLKPTCKACTSIRNMKYYKKRKLHIQTYLENDLENVMQE